MYCEHCGKKVNEEDQFCGSCGAPIKNEAKPIIEPTSTPAKEIQNSPSRIHDSLANDTSKEAQMLKAADEGLGMKWYKWLIYFALFFTAFTYIVAGFLALTGTQYDALYNALYGTEQSWGEYVYQMYPGLSIVDKIYGVFMLAAGVFAIIMRSRLTKFKNNASSQYIMFLLAILTISVIYSIASAILTKEANSSLVI